MQAQQDRNFIEYFNTVGGPRFKRLVTRQVNEVNRTKDEQELTLEEGRRSKEDKDENCNESAHHEENVVVHKLGLSQLHSFVVETVIVLN